MIINIFVHHGMQAHSGVGVGSDVMTVARIAMLERRFAWSHYIHRGC